jgi:succinyl-diaminopimelate desuccinylase
VTQRPVLVEGLTFHDTLCITRIHGGVARNVVPDRVEIALNVRFAPGREAAAARAEVEELVAGEGELTWLDESPAALPRLSEPVLARFLAETGVRVFPKQAWTDVASLQAHGIPAVNYGPGEAHQAHQPGEWVEGEAIARVASTLARFLQPR